MRAHIPSFESYNTRKSVYETIVCSVMLSVAPRTVGELVVNDPLKTGRELRDWYCCCFFSADRIIIISSLHKSNPSRVVRRYAYLTITHFSQHQLYLIYLVPQPFYCILIIFFWKFILSSTAQSFGTNIARYPAWKSSFSSSYWRVKKDATG